MVLVVLKEDKILRDYDNDCESLFLEEVREKKRTASGARHNSGRRGGGTKGITGHMTMPSDLLKYSDKKAYKEYTKGSVIVLSNNYENLENVPSIAELKDMDYDTAKSIATIAKSLHSNKELIEHWKISSGGLYSGVFDRFGVEYPKKANGNLIKIDKYADINLLPTLDELYKLNYDESRNILISVKQQHTVKEIREYWKIKASEYYEVLKKYEIGDIFKQRLKHKAAEKEDLIVKQGKILEDSLAIDEASKEAHFETVNEVNELQKENTILKYKLVESESQEFNLKYVKNNVSGEELQKRVMDYVGITYPESHYEIKLMIRELKNGK